MDEGDKRHQAGDGKQERHGHRIFRDHLRRRHTLTDVAEHDEAIDERAHEGAEHGLVETIAQITDKLQRPELRARQRQRHHGDGKGHAGHADDRDCDDTHHFPRSLLITLVQPGGCGLVYEGAIQCEHHHGKAHRQHSQQARDEP